MIIVCCILDVVQSMLSLVMMVTWLNLSWMIPRQYRWIAFFFVVEEVLVIVGIFTAQQGRCSMDFHIRGVTVNSYLKSITAQHVYATGDCALAVMPNDQRSISTCKLDWVQCCS